MKMTRKFLSVLFALALTCSLFTAFTASAESATLFGDVNGDGTVTSMDALRLFGHCSGKLALTEEQLTVADYNRDGTVNTADAARLYRYIGGQLKAQPLPAAPSAEELEVFRLINEERVAAGVAPVQYATPVQGFADIRADELGVIYSHTRPDGRRCFSVFEDFDALGYLAGGENIAIGYASPEEVMNGWMNSDGHRANILNPNFHYVIVGCIDLPEGNPYYNWGSGRAWVQLFIYDRYL